jgi:hypothetical protein
MRLFLALLASVAIAAVCWAQKPRILLPTLPPVAFSRAQTYVYTARTASAVHRSGPVTVGAITWQCGQNTCTTSGPWSAPGVGACEALTREVGAIVAYGRPGAALNAAELASCNSGAIAAATPALSPPEASPTLSLRTATLTLTGTGALAVRECLRRWR